MNKYRILKIKYRIIQRGDKFYPQTKTLFFWSTVYQRCEEGFVKTECWSYGEALQVLKDIKAYKEKPQPDVVVHEVYL